MVRAKFSCWNKEKIEEGFKITLAPVTSGSEENAMFFRYTPYGSCVIGTVNEAAAAQFEVGKEYYVDFTKVEEEKVNEQGN
jgi:hypothetical protein